jgi:hypothetical protein
MNTWCITVVVGLVTTSCGSPAATPTQRSKTATPKAHTSGCTIRGRVTLNGSPVEYYGVTVTHNYMLPFHPKATSINTTTGRFTVSCKPEDRVDLIIAGPGFARRVVAGITTGSKQDTNLGEIVVRGGNTVTGTLLDENNNPASNVLVRISQSDHETDSDVDPLTEMALGVQEVRTDRNGLFVIKGVERIEPAEAGLTIRAMIDGVSASHPHLLPNSDTDVHLVLRPVGTLSGVLRGADETTVIFIRTVTASMGSYTCSPDDTGTFEKRNLPEGSYELRLFPSDRSLGVVKIKKAQNTEVGAIDVGK